MYCKHYQGICRPSLRQTVLLDLLPYWTVQARLRQLASKARDKISCPSLSRVFLQEQHLRKVTKNARTRRMCENTIDLWVNLPGLLRVVVFECGHRPQKIQNIYVCSLCRSLSLRQHVLGTRAHFGGGEQRGNHSW